MQNGEPGSPPFALYLDCASAEWQLPQNAPQERCVIGVKVLGPVESFSLRALASELACTPVSSGNQEEIHAANLGARGKKRETRCSIYLRKRPSRSWSRPTKVFAERNLPKRSRISRF